MAQGSRGRFALLGAGMLLCTGVVGCMDSDPKPLKLKGPQLNTPTPGLMGSTVKPNQTGTGTTYGGGVQPASWNTPSGRTPGAVGGTSTFGTPSVPGAMGSGASMAPGGSGVVPSIAPPGPSNYPTSGGYQGSAPPTNPPQFGYDVAMPPPAGAGYPATSPGYPMPPQAPTK